MASRADILGDTGAAAPEHWVGGLAGDDLHAIVILFARDEEERVRCVGEHDALLARCPGVRSLSHLDLAATAPFEYDHDHFGYRDPVSQPQMRGSGEVLIPGSGGALEPGEFLLGYPDEDQLVANQPTPEVLSRNGSYTGLPPTRGACRGISGLPAAERRRRRGRGVTGRQVHGPLAQWCTVGAGTGSR